MGLAVLWSCSLGRAECFILRHVVVVVIIIIKITSVSVGDFMDAVTICCFQQTHTAYIYIYAYTHTL